MNVKPGKIILFKIYYVSSGFGLVKDAKILAQTLSDLGHECEIFELPSRSARYGYFMEFFYNISIKFNLLYFFSIFKKIFYKQSNVVSFHLESLCFEKLFLNERHILIPNQEWYTPHLTGLLKYVDSVWCKSHIACHVFKEFIGNVKYIGFCSEIDPVFLQLPKRNDYFFCRTGMSVYRGAQNLMNVWADHPEWPVLKISIHPSRRPAICPKNVEYVEIFASNEEYYRLAASSLFHIYPTEAEGFGHSIVEAMAFGSVVLITDAPPMNEIANSACAILMSSEYAGQKTLSPSFSVKPDALEAAINRVLSMSVSDLEELGRNANLQYNSLKKEFISNFKLQIDQL